jgi:alpha-tubulin suppressor-like RCC1 family protein
MNTTNRRLVLASLLLGIGGLALGAPAPAIAAGNSVYEWGKQVAVGGPGPHPTIVQTFPQAVVAIDAGNESDMAVLADGSVWGWGQTQVAPQSMSAVQIPGLVNVVQPPVDGNHDYAALEQPGTNPSCPTSSTVKTWGLNGGGDLGIGDKKFSRIYMTPQDVTTLDCENVVQLAAGNGHMLALTANGSVYVWGGSLEGAGTQEKVPTLDAAATALTGGTSVGVAITSGVETDGLLVNGQAYSWGSNIFGQCGCGSTARLISTPTAVVQNGVLFTRIDQGGDFAQLNGHELALTADGSVYAWGYGGQGSLGTGTTANSDVPVAVGGLPTGITDVRAGGQHSMALDPSGNVWTWGSDAKGQIGSGRNELLPTEVLSGVTMISAGSLHSLAE